MSKTYYILIVVGALVGSVIGAWYGSSTGLAANGTAHNGTRTFCVLGFIIGLLLGFVTARLLEMRELHGAEMPSHRNRPHAPSDSEQSDDLGEVIEGNIAKRETLPEDASLGLLKRVSRLPVPQYQFKVRPGPFTVIAVVLLILLYLFS